MSGGGENSSGWYHDQETLLSVIRRSRPPQATPPLIVGYDDVRELHRGGQGAVYSALQRSTKRRVAVKVLLGGDLASDAARRRFEREVDLAAGLRHPNIVAIHDSGRTQAGQLYFVMELIEGVPLDAWSADSAGKAGARLRERLNVFRKVCEAVHHAHQHGVIHRDLKPSNVRVDAAGEPHVLDFGLAKHAEPGATVTEEGRFVGSLPWASPEQARGEPRAIGVRSDIYSLGVMLYQLVTDRFPYDVESGLRTTLENIVSAEPSRPSSVAPHARGDLDTIILRCLAKEPARRYQSGAELADDLTRCLAGEPIAARRETAWEAMRRRARRNRAAVWAASTVAGVSMTAALLSFNFWKDTEAANTRTGVALRDAQKATRRAQASAKYLADALRSPNPSVQGRDVRVVEVLDQAAKDAAETLADDPETLVDVRATLAETYLNLSLFEQADEQAAAGLALARQAIRDESPEAVRLAALLSRSRQHRGKLDDAAALNAQWLPIAHRVLGAAAPETLVLAETQASLLMRLGRWHDAELLWRDLLDRRTRTLGRDHPDTLTAMGMLAQALSRQSRYKDAAGLVERLLDTRTRVLGPEAPDTISSMSDLAWNKQQMGNVAAAEPLFARAAELSAKVNGPEHAMTLIVTSNRAAALVKLGRAAEAEPIYRTLIETQTRLRGPEHEQVLNVMNAYAVCLRKLGRDADAEPIARKIVEIAARTLGPTHPGTLGYDNTLAASLLARKKPDEALAILENAWPAAKEKLGESHALSCTLRSNLARALAAVSRFD